MSHYTNVSPLFESIHFESAYNITTPSHSHILSPHSYNNGDQENSVFEIPNGNFSSLYPNISSGVFMPLYLHHPNPFCPTREVPDRDKDGNIWSLSNRSSYLYLIFELIVAIFTIIGNSITILVFVKNRKLRRITNYYIVSLAAADFLVGVLGIPFAILTSLGKPEAQGPCLSMLCTLILLCTISIFSLVGVSVDRYWAILYPMPYARLMTATRARCE